ncbi:hypothetical protein, partial [Mesorhizobium sp. M1D.F.Ca.ET.234.01.1.1]|uniref:hypothetical protein n=1 Tax=Mesorhizobium sp. M1D.F.Ca.ET.234.01.1.1 TaxID=2563932 RepID=UPI001AEE250B
FWRHRAQIWSYQTTGNCNHNITGPVDEKFKAKLSCAKTVSGETSAKGHNPLHSRVPTPVMGARGEF